VLLDDESKRVEVVVPDEQLSLAIGRRGQNVRLASQLTRYDIDIMTEAGESERRQLDFNKRSALFVEALDVDDMIAGLLVTEGYSTIEEIIDVEEDELAGIEGFDEAIATELKRRGLAFLEGKEAEAETRRVELGVEDAIAEIGTFTAGMMVQLGEAGIKTLDDLADLAGDELLEIIGAEAMDEETANAVIMAARAHWFDEDGEAQAAPG
jgi:transcription termination/antitermination protein NusA